jgi:CRP-like cAMP-binding protein
MELKYEYKKRGDFVFKYGDVGDKFYVILKGSVTVRIPNPKKKND